MTITVQSTYSTGPTSGFPGMVANGETSNRITRTIEDSAGLAFGKAAFRGSDDLGVVGAPAAGTFMGIAIADAGVVAPVGGTADVYPQYANVSLLNEGCIYVPVAVNVADGDAAYVTSGGVITNVSTSNTAIPAKFDETVSSGGVARLRVTRS